jgi:uncharacterized protein
VNEPGAETVHRAVAGAAVCSHWIAYPEMCAALARLLRLGRQTIEAHKQHKREFERDWKAVRAILPDERILRRAGELAERFGLRGYDSVHLAAAESLFTSHGRDFLHFASFDDALNEAAAEIGLRLLTAG